VWLEGVQKWMAGFFFKWRNSIDVVEGGKAVLAAVGVVIGEPGLDLVRQWGGSWQQCAWSVLPSLNVLEAHRAV
jgi:hypothetical protein